MIHARDHVLEQAALQHYLDDVCPENHVEALLDVVRQHTDEDLPRYSDSLSAAFARVEPVFARKRYAEFFWHCASRVPGWIARVVLANGQAESEGSLKLYELWKEIHGNPEVEDQVIRHAEDESRHSRIFVRLTEKAFPTTFCPPDLRHFEEALPDARRLDREKSAERIPEAFVIDHLVQMNIGEIRTRLHMHLYAPVILAFTPDENRLAVRRLLEGLVRDEVRHIGYTARLMERWAEDGWAERIRRLYTGRLHAFDHLTYTQTAQAVHDYGQGRFPDLLEI